MTRTTAVVLLACAAQAVIGADGLAVAISLPALQDDLDVRAIDGQWVLSAYALAFGGSLLLGGRLGDLYGHRRVLAWGMALFAGGSLVAALAPGLGAVIAARAAQGLGAAAAIPASLAVIGAVFPPGRERTRALARLAAMASVGVVTGLVLGGVVTQLLGWRWVFALLALPTALTAAAAPRVLPELREARAAAGLDVPGALLATAGMLALMLGLTRAERDGAAAGALLVLGAALLAGFAAWEARAAEPLVRLRILRVRTLRAAALGAAANAVAFTAIVYAGTLFLQRRLGYRPLEAGLALLPLDVVAFAVPLAASGWLARQSPRALLAASFAATAAALLWLARVPAPAVYATDLLLPLSVLGVSLSVAFVVLTTAAVADVPADEKGVASGIFETANHLLGGAVGAALYATLIAASGYGAAFAAAAGLALLGLVAAYQAPRRSTASAP